ncbi:MAG: hypothetical protein Tsb0019_27010 [Roseibium sp.]
MTVAREHLDAGDQGNRDALNRDIAHEARTDQALESQVPPVSKYGTGWRIAAAVLLLVAAAAALAVWW